MKVAAKSSDAHPISLGLCIEIFAVDCVLEIEVIVIGPNSALN